MLRLTASSLANSTPHSLVKICIVNLGDERLSIRNYSCTGDDDEVNLTVSRCRVHTLPISQFLWRGYDGRSELSGYPNGLEMELRFGDFRLSNFLSRFSNRSLRAMPVRCTEAWSFFLADALRCHACRLKKNSDRYSKAMRDLGGSQGWDLGVGVDGWTKPITSWMGWLFRHVCLEDTEVLDHHNTERTVIRILGHKVAKATQPFVYRNCFSDHTNVNIAPSLARRP
ncbi:hypothetical protein BJ508DRAFT_343554 [Ascobolus immersus RN42]|uniref:Uncharacterized protein n=1 Tax=Ascobolus immersus RN42 TaxID=1160509 RepID=A0A3N4HJK6_ASCIM|nr:hypothetical protein BJ508DRAFT_343554 [Ascobolus immersus RN42]